MYVPVYVAKAYVPHFIYVCVCCMCVKLLKIYDYTMKLFTTQHALHHKPHFSRN